MVEAVVAVALRSILAGIVLSGILIAVVFFATRALALNASTRHALWTTALIATAIMPLAGFGMSVLKGAPADAARPAHVSWHGPASLAPSGSSSSDAAARHQSPSSPARTGGAATTPARTAVDPLAALGALARWTPHLSRVFAVAVVGIWLTGAAIGLIGLGLSIVRVRGLKKRSSPLDGALADELPWLTDVGPGREIYLRLSFEIETPVAIGFRRPVILIPTELASAGGLAAIESLVLHEYAHLRRYDDWTNLLQRIIERVFWFNPLLWLVGRRIALEREIASDDAVVEKTGAAHEYATSLWRLAREMRMPEHAVVAPGALLTRKQISVRIEQLLDKNRSRLHRSPAAALGVFLAGTVAVACVATSAPAVELPASAPLASATDVHATAVPILPSTRPIAPHDTTHHAQGAPQRIIIYRHTETALVPSSHASAPHRGGTATKRLVLIAQGPSVPPLPPPPAAPSLPAPAHDMSSEIAAAVRDAMASIPAQVAQESSGAPQAERSLTTGTKLSRDLIAACTGCSLRNADLRGLDLHGLSLTGLSMSGADLRGANLSGARLTGVSLARANLANADLRGASLNGVSLQGANFDGALLDDIKLTGVSFHHVSLRGTSLRGVVSNCTGCDFSGMDLHGQDLHGISLNGADLRGADLHDANLSGVKFVGVDLAHANLSGADLTGASFNGCDLRGTNRSGIKNDGGLRLMGSDIE